LETIAAQIEEDDIENDADMSEIDLDDKELVGI
jgi:hypothetical protein